MAYYALMNAENIVINVITGVDENISQVDIDGTTVGGTTEAWELFYASQSWHGAAYCKRTSFNGISNGFRKQFATIGGVYDPVADEFVDIQPFPSWTLDSNNNWQPPVPKPDNTPTKVYDWEESSLSWVVRNLV